jgi:hemerythrin-like domain-containing protein
MIGAKRQSDFTDPVGMLADCHRRIERFLNVLATMASQEKGGPVTEQQRTALETSLRYFRESAPKHTADEEESLFPRLRRVDHAGLQAILAHIDSLEHDHECAGKAHDEVDRLGQMWLANGRISPEEALRLSTVLDQLVRLYRRHIAIEDTEIFPFASERAPSLRPRVRERRDGGPARHGGYRPNDQFEVIRLWTAFIALARLSCSSAVSRSSANRKSWSSSSTMWCCIRS